MLDIVTREGIDAELLRISKRMSSGKAAALESVKSIVDDVAGNGDKAVIKYAKKFDGVKLLPKDFKVTPKEIESAYKAVNSKFLLALKAAIRNIRAYHEKQKIDQWFETLPEDVVMGLRSLPIERIGIYVPGGAVPYPSSVLMNAIPAKIAGVGKIVMVAPPAKQRTKAVINPHILVAAAEIGVSSIYKVGGAQAVAALAYGTETIPKVDKIVGPGNMYVTLAKKYVYGDVGIDKLAGPSDVVIIADENSEPEFIAADMLAQAEHDPNSSAILITTSAKIAFSVKEELSKQVKKLSRKVAISKAIKENGAIFVVDGLKSATELSNRIAPEHLEIMASSPQRILEQIKNAGAVFMGPHSPAVVGDYIAGPNHVLPTGGASRFSSPLGVYDFVKKQSVVGYTKSALKSVREDIKVLAGVEKLDAHARAVDVRFE
jgi:histidinol dehydrogenase